MTGVEIVGKLADALSMFWQSLDERERQVLAVGACYLLGMILLAPFERARRERQQAELAERVAHRLKEAHHHA